MKKLLILIHLTNIAWIFRLLMINPKDVNPYNNYWEDSIFTMLLLVSCCLQLYRWVKISEIKIDMKLDSAILLKTQLKKIADEMFGKTPYLLKLCPSDHLLESSANQYIKDNLGKTAKMNITLQEVIFRIKNYLAVNLMILLICCLYIYFGSLPSYAEFLKQIPVVSKIILCMAGGLFLYSLAFLLFWVFLFFNKRA